MATLLAFRSVTPRAFFVMSLGVSTVTILHARQIRRPLLCEGVGIKDKASGVFSSYQRDAEVPVLKSDGKVNRRIFRQISSGSILGLLGGLAVSTFSKPITVLIGALVAGMQYLESRGIHIVPKDRIQRYFGNINVRSAIENNVAFKVSFGTMFALAAFAEF